MGWLITLGLGLWCLPAILIASVACRAARRKQPAPIEQAQETEIMNCRDCFYSRAQPIGASTCSYPDGPDLRLIRENRPIPDIHVCLHWWNIETEAAITAHKAWTETTQL